MTMGETYSVEELEFILRRVRTGAHKFVTNFFTPHSQLSTWLQRGLRVLAATERFVVLMRTEESCTRLFFSGHRADMMSAISAAMEMVSRPAVVDLIGKSPAIEEIAAEFSSYGFMPYL